VRQFVGLQFDVRSDGPGGEFSRPHPRSLTMETEPLGEWIQIGTTGFLDVVMVPSHVTCVAERYVGGRLYPLQGRMPL
jgi:hypothetical protein